MLHTDLLMGRFDRVEGIARDSAGRTVRASAPAGDPVVLVLPSSPAALANAREALAEMTGPGVPAARTIHDGATGRIAVEIDVSPDVRSLGDWSQLPPATLRAGLVSMLSVLSRAHLRGRVHTGVSGASILASPAGEFWLVGWGASRRLGDAIPDAGFSPVARDVRELGMAFVAALVDGFPAGGVRAPTLADLGGRGADRDFRRVLSRLLAPDPREAYSTAGEVLADLGHPDTLDPWQFVPFVERAEAVRQILRLVDRASTGNGAPAALEIVGPHGAGRSRLLAWIAGSLRARGSIVLLAEAAACPWGGLASLARQLTQLVGRDSLPWQQHADVLQHLVDDGGESIDARVLPAATALAALAEAAFRDGSGALLLDDADLLTHNAAETWRSLRRQATATLGGRVLFASARVASSATVGDAPTEIVPVAEWSVGEVREFLEGVLATPELAADAAPVLRDLAGGRPAEIVGLLRDLQRGGSLTRVGNRWHLDIPLHALEDWTPTDAEVVRRALRAAGRDATGLVEVLAVAGEPLPRDVCGRLAELPGPRLWGAAEQAEAAGLLRRDGTTWRLRSEHIRSRVLAAMSTSRRRSLHREMLEVVRAADAEALPAQARHARAAGHHGASELTRRAVGRLTEGGYYDTAVAQLVDAEQLLGDPEWGRAAWAERVDLLRLAGRLGEALTLVDRLLAHPDTTDAERADALVRRIHVVYESRDFDAVVDQELPEDLASSEQLAELRYMRAAAMSCLCERPRAEREARLAAAEVGVAGESLAIRLARLEHEWQLAFQAGAFREAQRSLLLRVRSLRAARRWPAVACDIGRIAGAYRKLGDLDRAVALLTRAHAVLDEVPEGSRHRRGALVSALGVAEGVRQGADDFEAQFRYANLFEQTSAPILVSVARVRRVFARVLGRRHDGSDHSALSSTVRRVSSASRSELLALSFSLAGPLQILGYQPALEEFGGRLAECGWPTPRVAIVHAVLLRSRLLWSDPVIAPLERIPARCLSCFRSPTVAPGASSGRLPSGVGAMQPSPRSYTALAMAWSLRSGRPLDVPHAEQWTPAARLALLRCDEVGPGVLSLALALAIWGSEELDPITWRWIEWIRASYDGTWFPQLRWQAHLLDCKQRWRAGRLDAAAQSARRALDQARWLRSERFGEWGAREHAFAVRAIAERAPATVLREIGGASSPPVPVPVPVRDLASPSAPCAAALPALTRDAHLVAGPDVATLMRFLGSVLPRPIPDDAQPGLHVEGGTDVVLLPELLGPDELRGALATVRAARSARRRALVCTTLRDDEIEAAGVGVRLVLKAATGSPIRLGVGAAPPRERLAHFEAALARERSGLQIATSARAVLAAHEWPGGAAQVESVARVAAALAAAEVTPEILRRAGLCGGPSGHRDPATRTIVAALEGVESRSVAELEDLTGLSRRTLQRRLQSLTRDHVLQRVGRGPSVRYLAAEPQA